MLESCLQLLCVSYNSNGLDQLSQGNCNTLIYGRDDLVELMHSYVIIERICEMPQNHIF